MVDQGVKIDPRLLQLQLTGVGPGKLQSVVETFQEVLAALDDLLRVFFLFCRKRAEEAVVEHFSIGCNLHQEVFELVLHAGFQHHPQLFVFDLPGDIREVDEDLAAVVHKRSIGVVVVFFSYFEPAYFDYFIGAYDAIQDVLKVGGKELMDRALEIVEAILFIGGGTAASPRIRVAFSLPGCRITSPVTMVARATKWGLERGK